MSWRLGSDVPSSVLQLKKRELAAAAAHTFFVANPMHLQMREDIAKYRRMPGLRPQSFRDLETPPYWVRLPCHLCLATTSLVGYTSLCRPRCCVAWTAGVLGPSVALDVTKVVTKVECSHLLIPRPAVFFPKMPQNMEPMPQVRPALLCSVYHLILPSYQMAEYSPSQQADYDTGLELLGRQEVTLALPRLEEALQGCLAQLESCRAACEGPEEQETEEEEEKEEEGTESQAGLYLAIAGER